MHRKAIKHNAKWQQASGEAGLVVWSVWFGLDGAAWGQISAKLCPRRNALSVNFRTRGQGLPIEINKLTFSAVN